MVFVDKLSKFVRFAPTTTECCSGCSLHII